ncbi:MarR family winged helix-turn-helix transcriptional regulator [Emticicia aquatica]|jgi:DNA-binding MarR family transcriptional regulator|nr:MarR family winged helix-turn-helix transcriptional regulator [Emticicia aquatica]
MNESILAEIAAFKANKERLLGRLLNRTYRYMSDLASDYLKGIGYENFRVGHIVALVQIELEGTSINKLASNAGMTKQGMSKLIKELQAEGFVLVEKDQADARALIVKHTEKGLQALLDWKSCTQFINQRFTEVLGDSKLEILKDLLHELVHEYDHKYLCSSKHAINHPMLRNSWMSVK